MWKIAIGFLVFAAVAIWLLLKGGDIDMSGEQHGVASHQEEKPADKPADKPAEAPAAAAPAATPAPADKPAEGSAQK